VRRKIRCKRVVVDFFLTRFEKMYRGQSEGGGSVAEQVDDLRERMRLLQGALILSFLYNTSILQETDEQMLTSSRQLLLCI